MILLGTCQKKIRREHPINIENVNETLAKQGVDMIGRLFGIEKEIDKLEPEEKARIRQERSKPVVESSNGVKKI